MPAADEEGTQVLRETGFPTELEPENWISASVCPRYSATGITSL